MDEYLTTYLSYIGFYKFWYASAECEEFIKTFMPDGFWESIYDTHWKKPDFDSVEFIKSFIKMCGLSKQEIPHFDKYEKENSLNAKSIIYGHNDLYSFEIRYRCCIKYDGIEIRFYRYDGKHFLTFNTYLNRSGRTNAVERYRGLLTKCLNSSDDDRPKEFSIGSSCGYRKKYGFYVIVTGNAYFCPYEHEETLSPNESFKEFYESIKRS